MTAFHWQLFEVSAYVAAIIGMGSFFCLRAGLILSIGWSMWALLSLAQPIVLLPIAAAWLPWATLYFLRIISSGQCSGKSALLGGSCSLQPSLEPFKKQRHSHPQG